MAELLLRCEPVLLEKNTERGFQQRKASQIYTERLSHKNKQTWSAEMAQHLRAAAAQAEDLALGLNTYMAVQTIHRSVPRDLTLSSNLREHQTHMWYTNICTGKTLTLIK